jgi:hypothetical protein
VRYGATVALHHHIAQPEQISETPVARLPMDVMGYVYPSRYCQSDQLHRLAVAEFGQLWQGYSRVQAIQEWVQRRVKFTNNASNSNTSALETLRDGVGICRDFAHLMIALCRAVNIPARFTTGIDYGADPALGPTDFHAYVEVYLGHRHPDGLRARRHGTRCGGCGLRHHLRHGHIGATAHHGRSPGGTACRDALRVSRGAVHRRMSRHGLAPAQPPPA